VTGTARQCVFCKSRFPIYECGQTPKSRSPLEIEAEKAGLCPVVVRVATGEGEKDFVNFLSIALIRMVEDRKQRQSKNEWSTVRTGGAIPDSLVNRLTREMLNACEDKDEFSTNFLELIRLQLDGVRRWRIHENTGILTEIEQDDRSELAPKTKAALYLAAHPNAGNRQVANIVGVDHTTIRRWRMEHGFKDAVAECKKVKNLKKLFPPASQET